MGKISQANHNNSKYFLIVHYIFTVRKALNLQINSQLAILISECAALHAAQPIIRGNNLCSEIINVGKLHDTQIASSLVKKKPSESHKPKRVY